MDVDSSKLSNHIPLAPVPTSVSIGTTTTEEGAIVLVVQVTTPVGVAVYFFSPQEAAKISKAILEVTEGIRN